MRSQKVGYNLVTKGDSPIAQSGKNPLAMQKTVCNTVALSSIPGSGRYLGEGNGNPLHWGFQYSCLGNSMDRGTCRSCSSWGHKEADTT